MKSISTVRKLEDLGRIVIPMEIRRSFEIVEKDQLEIFVDGDNIVLKKYVPGMTCMMTGEISNLNLKIANGKIVLSRNAAKELLEELKEVLES